MSRFNRQRAISILRRLSRVILGSALLVSILAVNIPSALVASGPMCNLACCAGKAPHAAGSCMNGSCHAFLGDANPKLHFRHEIPVEPVEQWCGLTRLKATSALLPIFASITVEFNADSSADASRATSKNTSDRTRLSTTAITKPCQPECGGVASGFTGSKRYRDLATLAYADRPRPPSGTKRSKARYLPSQQLSTLWRCHTPRGPPSS
jgi:hypothetical protein